MVEGTAAVVEGGGRFWWRALAVEGPQPVCPPPQPVPSTNRPSPESLPSTTAAVPSTTSDGTAGVPPPQCAPSVPPPPQRVPSTIAEEGVPLFKWVALVFLPQYRDLDGVCKQSFVSEPFHRKNPIRVAMFTTFFCLAAEIGIKLRRFQKPL